MSSIRRLFGIARLAPSTHIQLTLLPSGKKQSFSHLLSPQYTIESFRTAEGVTFNARVLGKATVAAPNGRDLANDAISRIVVETKKAVHKKVTIRFTINDGVTVLDEKGAVYTQSRIHKVTGWYIHETEQESFCFIFKGEVRNGLSVFIVSDLGMSCGRMMDSQHGLTSAFHSWLALWMRPRSMYATCSSPRT